MSTPLILLADDEPHITHIISNKLKKAGFETIIAQDGELAFCLALEHKPALIISDLQMPYLSGIELAQQLFDSELKFTPIILLTARGYTIEDQIQSLPNIKQLLSKPFSAKDLVNLTEETLAKSTGNDQADLRGAA